MVVTTPPEPPYHTSPHPHLLPPTPHPLITPPSPLHPLPKGKDEDEGVEEKPTDDGAGEVCPIFWELLKKQPLMEEVLNDLSQGRNRFLTELIVVECLRSRLLEKRLNARVGEKEVGRWGGIMFCLQSFFFLLYLAPFSILPRVSLSGPVLVRCDAGALWLSVLNP